MSNSSLFTPALLRTHSFVLFAVHETRNILLSPFISKASRRVSSFFLRVQLSQPYVATGHTSAFISRLHTALGYRRETARRRRVLFRVASNAQFTPPVRHDKTVLSVSCQAVWIQDSRAKSEHLADTSPSSRDVLWRSFVLAICSSHHAHIVFTFCVAYNVAACMRSGG